MSAETAAPAAEAKTDSTTALVTQRAATALKAAETEKQLLELVKQSIGITTITNPAGLQECHAARMVLKNRRVDIEKLGKTARDDALAFQKAVIGEERRLVAIIAPEERRLEVLQEAWTAAREAEKEAARQKEVARVQAIQDAIDVIAGWPADAVGKTSAQIADLIAGLEAMPIGESFSEFKGRAETIREISLAKLRNAERAAAVQEAEVKRLTDERAELARQRAEQDERDRLQRAEQARLAADEKARREKIEADERAARERIEAAEREARQKREEEARRLRAEQDARDAEAKRIRDAEEARLKQERDALELAQRNERLAREERERAAREAQEKAERDARGKAEAAEAAKREKERKAKEAAEAVEREKRLKAEKIEDGRAHLQAFVHTFGELHEFVIIAQEIREFLEPAEVRQRQLA